MRKASSIQDISRETRTPEERRIPKDSYYEIEFEDGTKKQEREVSWQEFSEERKVKFLDGERTVPISKFRIKKITLSANGKTVVLVPKEDEEVYQMIHSRTVFVPGGNMQDIPLGRVVGLVKENVVVEERYISLITDEVVGFKK